MKKTEELKGFGISTFVGSDYVNLNEVKNYEIAVIGCPDEM